ncbi:PEP phosphonomutase-like protein [Phaeosphaeria sp. MPI-PUGE-AT-0046c]|nr:PEP phosphonomutase-like protein [Phaeosphaeria sp. MPI-PUGE-AT-0046c]
MSTQNTLARHFRALHSPSPSPLVLTNVWDAISATSIASLPSTRALATASYAIAAAAGISDDDLTLEINLRAVAIIARVAAAHDLPLTVDFQDGFGEQLEEGVRKVIELGAVGINLEDYAREKEGLYEVGEAQERVRRVMKVAADMGVPDFVVNARTDALFSGGTVDDAIARGKAYLEAGAANVFIWGGPARKGWAREEVQRAVRELGGKLNVILIRMDGTGRPAEGLSVQELKEIGVSRISVGPQLMKWTAKKMGEEARRILEGEKSGL